MVHPSRAKTALHNIVKVRSRYIGVTLKVLFSIWESQVLKETKKIINEPHRVLSRKFLAVTSHLRGKTLNLICPTTHVTMSTDLYCSLYKLILIFPSSTDLFLSVHWMVNLWRVTSGCCLCDSESTALVGTSEVFCIWELHVAAEQNVKAKFSTSLVFKSMLLWCWQVDFCSSQK